ncbi:DegV family protein [Trichococcus collinsii]|uniref:EDD domain protein, DegV family n=1 Tax=Trichococcus collinsii TaxID=157076 RepID=A0AB37ZZU0_9LACT|nr:DegV family protein [Trichococcus collinsii]CZQ87690.1 degv [Trichococcus collinsii]SEA42982.1 EDD domain protein, DegV family [Trichococcus collinsii]
MKIAVVTDSTAYLTAEIRQRHHIHMLPLVVNIGEKSYEEEIDLVAEDFYALMKSSEDFPKSSQPAVGAMYQLYEELAKDHDAIISVHLSSGISGTYQNAASLSREYPEFNIHPFDSEISCYVQARFVLEAARLAAAGIEPEQIIARLNHMKKGSRAYFMVDDLMNLQRGGRLSGGAAVIGSIMKIKPVLHFSDKKIVVFEKIRTNARALRRIEELLGQTASMTDYPIIATVIHGNIPEKGQAWLEHLQGEFPDIRFELSYFGPVIGTHLGEGALGLTWTEDTELSFPL